MSDNKPGPFDHLRQDILDNTAQSLLAAKASAANAVSIAESLMPLIDDAGVQTQLSQLQHHAQQARQITYDLYRLVARPAFAKDGGK